MPGFTFIVSHGGTRRSGGGGVDLAPLLLREDPTETFQKYENLGDSNGIVFMRAEPSGENTETSTARPVLTILRPFSDNDPRVENQGSDKYSLYETGTEFFTSGVGNSIYKTVSDTFRGGQGGIILNGDREPLSTPSQPSMGIDFGACDVRMPGGHAGMEPPAFDVSGTWKGDRWGGQGTMFAYRGYQQKKTIAGGTASIGFSLIPAGAYVYAVGYDVLSAAATDTANQFSIGVVGDLARFAGGLDSNQQSTQGIAYDTTVDYLRLYSADTSIVVTADGNFLSNFTIGIYVLVWQMISDVGPNFGAGWSG